MTPGDSHSLIGKRAVALILGGGRGSRLIPLTLPRCKPAVSIGGKYRLIDIPISNCINSGVNRIFVLTQFLSAGLNRHITRTYRFDSFGDRFVEILAAEQSFSHSGYAEGTADAVRKCVRYLEGLDADLVFILSGDQLCRVNLGEMFEVHRDSGAEVTLSCIGIPRAGVPRCGIVRTAADGRITEFAEKPTNPVLVDRFARPDGTFSGSMGIYLFDKRVLLELLRDNPDLHDFGKGIFPKAIGARRIHAYDYEGYWEDIGTIRSYFDASMALLGERPAFSFYDFSMPVYTHHRSLPAPKLFDTHADSSLVCEGSILRGARLKSAIVGIRSYIRPGAEIDRAVIMGNDDYPPGFALLPPERRDSLDFGWKRGVKVSRAIIDKNVVLGAGTVIRGTDDAGVNAVDPEGRFHIVDGVVVIPRGVTLPDNTVIEADSFK